MKLAIGAAALALGLVVVQSALSAFSQPNRAVAYATTPPNRAVAPAGGNGALLIQRSGSSDIFLLAPGSTRPRLLRGIALADGGGAAWSPDGLQLAFGADEIFIVDLRTRRMTLVASRGAEPAWSPDGSQLAYSSGGWIRIKTVGGRARRFARGADPSWSPVGSRLAYRDGSDLFVKTLAGGMRRLLKGGASDLCGYGGAVSYSSPDWSPSGSTIAYTAGYSCANQVGEVSSFSEIGVVDLAGRVTTFLSGAGSEGGPYEAVWSPDGRALAFSEDHDGELARLAMYHRSARRISTRLRGFWSALDWQPVCTLKGTPRPDRLRAKGSADLVCGLAGSDWITGGAGEDRLFGEDGNDRFFARDGEFDVVGCGAGRDSVVADRGDLVGRDCEQVSRSGT